MKTFNNSELLAAKQWRFPRFCLDWDIWGSVRSTSYIPQASWTTLKFEKKNYAYFKTHNLESQEGIYMFVLKTDIYHLVEQEFILYIGETSGLGKRFLNYFNYKNSDNPSDFKKRIMILQWEKHLVFKFIPTDFKSKQKREDFEYDLIDHVLPPFNDKFRSKIAKATMKLISV